MVLTEKKKAICKYRIGEEAKKQSHGDEEIEIMNS